MQDKKEKETLQAGESQIWNLEIKVIIVTVIAPTSQGGHYSKCFKYIYTHSFKNYKYLWISTRILPIL